MAPILVRASDFKPTMLLGVVVGGLPAHLKHFLAGGAGDAGVNGIFSRLIASHDA